MLGVALVGVAGMLVGDTSDAPRVDAACAISTNLGLGSRGTAVQCLQTTLNAVGYNAGPVDGVFGPMTYRVVRAFQQAKGLTVDGLVGRQTGVALGIWGTSTTPPATGSGCKVGTTLRIGSTGEQVRCLQRALNAAGYPVGPADGTFGSRTFAAVRSYQQARGLVVDGVAGRQTLSSLGIFGGSTTPAPSNSCAPRRRSRHRSAGRHRDAHGWEPCRRRSARPRRLEVDVLADGHGRAGRPERHAVPCPDADPATGPPRPASSRSERCGHLMARSSSSSAMGSTPESGERGGRSRRATAGRRFRIARRTTRSSPARPRIRVSPDEYLINFQQAYSRAAIIGANLGPNRSGDAVGEPPLAAAIFLHRHSYDAGGNARATSGCVSLGNENLIYVLQRLRPGQAFFVIRLG